jgi:hypothetical protein
MGMFSQKHRFGSGDCSRAEALNSLKVLPERVTERTQYKIVPVQRHKCGVSARKSISLGGEKARERGRGRERKGESE